MVLLVALAVTLPPADAGLTAAATDHLSRAADALAGHDYPGAVGPLRAHLKQYPDQVLVRVTLADVLWRTDPAAAGPHYAAVIAAAQSSTGAPKRSLPHCHTRLMKLAAANGRDADEEFHRGAALYWLALELGAEPEAADVYRRAAASLRLAAAGDAGPRPWVYLAAVAAAQGRVGAARAAARAALARPPFSLTDYERDLLLPWR